MDTKDIKKPIWISNRTDHMANERTFLAWIRTSVGIMAFGFVVEKFTLFMRQITYFFIKEGVQNTDLQPTEHTFSSIFGIFLVAIGALLGFFSYLKYKQIQRQINDDTYHSTYFLPLALTVSVVVSGAFLVFYLITS
jgi:putative membrane protein